MKAPTIHTEGQLPCVLSDLFQFVLCLRHLGSNKVIHSCSSGWFEFWLEWKAKLLEGNWVTQSCRHTSLNKHIYKCIFPLVVFPARLLTSSYLVVGESSLLWLSPPSWCQLAGMLLSFRGAIKRGHFVKVLAISILVWASQMDFKICGGFFPLRRIPHIWSPVSTTRHLLLSFSLSYLKKSHIGFWHFFPTFVAIYQVEWRWQVDSKRQVTRSDGQVLYGAASSRKIAGAKYIF